MTRRFVHPQPGDTLEAIAQRELPSLPPERAAEELLSWNLHLAQRLIGQVQGLLASDIVYVEPPPSA
jgi:hypothetical protein